MAREDQQESIATEQVRVEIQEEVGVDKDNEERGSEAQIEEEFMERSLPSGKNTAAHEKYRNSAQTRKGED